MPQRGVVAVAPTGEAISEKFKDCIVVGRHRPARRSDRADCRNDPVRCVGAPDQMLKIFSGVTTPGTRGEGSSRGGLLSVKAGGQLVVYEFDDLNRTMVLSPEKRPVGRPIDGLIRPVIPAEVRTHVVE